MAQMNDRAVVDTIRVLSMDAVEAARSGHPGTPMALAPLAWTLFSRLRKHNPTSPDWLDRDRFILSCGHASMLQYALLHVSGYALSLDEIKRFRQLDSLTPGHPEVFHTPGVEATTGPLGQGVAMGVGMAMAERHMAHRFNSAEHAVFDHRTWVIASDGDLMEGVSAEASSLAGHLKLNKLCVFWDDNKITIDGRTELAFTEDVLKRYQAYGWHTISVDDGEDLDALEAAGREAMRVDRPTLVRVRTVIGTPAPNLKDTSKAHGAPFGADEIAATKEILGVPNESFHVHSDVAAATAAMVERGQRLHADWGESWSQWEAENPSEAEALDRVLRLQIPELDLPTFEADAKGMATRAAGGKVLNAIAAQVPALIGGSADLAGSNKTALADADPFTPRNAPGALPREVHWGVREHGMAAAMNGMALHGGVYPFGATFLVFSDYMKPSIRLAALMNIPARYVFTHDSIGVGEDGPTHQPVEQLAMLRSIPNMAVFRPCDANETAECWRQMMKMKGPSAIVLTRQNLPTLDRVKLTGAAETARGGYALNQVEAPDVVLIATGSEVALALDAAEQLNASGKITRVVSMPCTALFDAQDASYRNALLPTRAKRIVVEAGTRFGWGGYGTEFVTMDSFGASAPAGELFKKFGFTVERIVELANQR